MVTHTEIEQPAAEATAACGGNREARLGQPSAFQGPAQGAEEKQQRQPERQRRKQGGAVGAAASRMQATAQQTLGAATRHGRGAPERARMLTERLFPPKFR